ncbi:hypothetical protein AU198_22545 [Mycobacterium sp. GA-1199]|uniref:DUF732 domain-containing protein n=1 Tax=Mycobacterium sp. GA-1199 TaxID=1772287 RepID=UPI0007484F64|nr:DUF732 domain-containing protein [Mycobacterium sp. GA-1199]KUI47862.1 hypothetical protein AU198_22545 [Mycobacterium sp. GA-1199]
MRGGIIFSAVVGVAMALGTAAPALADETDDIFVSVLEGEGFPFSTPKDAISLAHAVCDYVAAGQKPEQVAVEISEPANWTLEQSGFFVGAATQSYCPS